MTLSVVSWEFGGNHGAAALEPGPAKRSTETHSAAGKAILHSSKVGTSTARAAFVLAGPGLLSPIPAEILVTSRRQSIHVEDELVGTVISIMSSDTRQTTRGSVRSKRRLTDDNRADDPASNPKRQRVSRACDSCRSKKDKCDGAQPVCSTCASLSRPCTYRANPKKRGIPTGYIRTLELLWGLVFRKIQGSEEVVRTLLRGANIPGHLESMGKEAEGSDTLLSSWRNSIVLKEIERVLTSLEQPEDEQELGEIDSPADVEAASVLSSETLEWHLPDPLGGGRETSLAIGSSPVRAAPVMQTSNRITRNTGAQTAPIDDQFERQPLQHQADIPDSVPPNRFQQLPSNPWPLLDIYFSYTQCWFPILEKHDILRTAFRNADDDRYDSPTSPGSGDKAALWAVFALASIQQSSISTTRQLREDRLDPSQLYAKARSLIPGENGSHEIGHVQALLILSLIKLGQQDWAASWILVGLAVRIAQSLGLNYSPNSSSSATDESKTVGRSRHVFLGCFVLETLIAAQTGQVPSLRKGDLTMIGPINEDGLEEWHPWEDQTGLRPVESSRGSFHRGPLHALSTFNRLRSLMFILNDLCCWGQASTNSPSHLEALEQQLQTWVSVLPRSYRIDWQTVSTKPASPHIFALEMIYEAVATAISLQISLQRNERSGLQRAAEGYKRLISLIQAYTETYSLSATCPTFGIVLTLGLPPTGARRHAPWVFEADPGIKHKLQSFSAHLARVWTHDSQLPQTISESTTSTAPAALLQGNPYRSPSAQNVSRNNLRVANLISESRSGNLSTRESFRSPTWMRTSSNDENAALSLPTPAASLNIGLGIEASNSTSQRDLQHQHRSSVSGRPNGAPMLSDLPTPFSTTGPQYQQTYNDASLQFNSLVDLEGHGSLRPPRIAPDLDALFDELASLDGTERWGPIYANCKTSGTLT
ncbi:fungal-specific transcription factor domain-containing protein [Talaromyces proteolyticus]|uniref:Fungal-specific transcription factor domain-containing protein n=1 Tax=Talaromyces proteolyticus TaxID=1131652 RepID=A0AAD4L188_9EURO|nr:fungal-specific transcription factor domain-containing protein [Talaromyces proteolyticus]KAH8703786.1 fungal-specific transcription factor domain-containing protein [Talaromyces proteolyticus]